MVDWDTEQQPGFKEMLLPYSICFESQVSFLRTAILAPCLLHVVGMNEFSLAIESIKLDQHVDRAVD